MKEGNWDMLRTIRIVDDYGRCWAVHLFLMDFQRLMRLIIIISKH